MVTGTTRVIGISDAIRYGELLGSGVVVVAADGVLAESDPFRFTTGGEEGERLLFL